METLSTAEAAFREIGCAASLPVAIVMGTCIGIAVGAEEEKLGDR